MISSPWEAVAALPPPARMPPWFPTGPVAAPGTKLPFISCSRPASPQFPLRAISPRPDHFCWVSCLFLWGLSPKDLNSFTTKVTGLFFFFFNNPWKGSQLEKERNSTFSQIQLLNNLNESYLSLLKTAPTLCSLMWTEKKLCTNVQNLSPRRWHVLHRGRRYCFGRSVPVTGSAEGFHRDAPWQIGLRGLACG